MQKFYYKFQWLAAVSIPLIFIFLPEFLGIKTQWNWVLTPYLLSLALITLLTAIAVTTTLSSKKKQDKSLNRRVTSLLESTYLTAIASIAAAGDRAADSNSMLVSVLLDRKVIEDTAWAVNDWVRTILIILVFFFAATALISAIVEHIAFKHRTVEKYEIDNNSD